MRASPPEKKSLRPFVASSESPLDSKQLDRGGHHWARALRELRQRRHRNRAVDLRERDDALVLVVDDDARRARRNRDALHFVHREVVALLRRWALRGFRLHVARVVDLEAKLVRGLGLDLDVERFLADGERHERVAAETCNIHVSGPVGRGAAREVAAVFVARVAGHGEELSLAGGRVEHRHREALGGLVDVALDAAAAVTGGDDHRVARHHLGVRNDERLDVAAGRRVNHHVRERVALAGEARR